jgi:hypothetical protein
MSSLPGASKIVSTTFNNDLNYVFSVTQVYTVTVAYTGTGMEYSGTVTLNSGYNTTNYKVVPSIVCTQIFAGQYVYPVIITSRTETAFTYSIYVAAEFGSAQTITLDFLVIYSLEQVLNGNFDTTPPVPTGTYHRPSDTPVYIIDNWTWTGSGVFILNNSLVTIPFGNGNMGAQCVLFQIYPGGGSHSASISQDIKLYAGKYKFNMYLIQRGANPVTLNITIGTIYTTTITPSSTVLWTSAEAIIQPEMLKFDIPTTDTYTLNISAIDPAPNVQDHETAMTGISITLV